MRSPIEGKNVLITGASAGIGEACARLFAKNGANLILTARRTERLAKLADEIKKDYKVKAIYRQLDVSNKNSVAEVFRSLKDGYEKIDILINNAGLALGLDKFQNSNPDDYDAVIDTNVKGLLYCTRAVITSMIERNSGHIINIGSIAGHEVYQGGSIYCATKHAVHAIYKALRIDLLGTAVRMSSIDPGMVETEFSVVRFKGDSEIAKKVYEAMTPLRADDIADAVLYCASRPAHVNINEIILMPVDQASAVNVSRKP